ncbi:hypothetical protein D3C77_743040 [compost metagenome]
MKFVNARKPSVLVVCLVLSLCPRNAAEPPDSENPRVRVSLQARPAKGSILTCSDTGSV